MHFTSTSRGEQAKSNKLGKSCEMVEAAVLNSLKMHIPFSVITDQLMFHLEFSIQYFGGRAIKLGTIPQHFEGPTIWSGLFIPASNQNMPFVFLISSRYILSLISCQQQVIPKSLFPLEVLDIPKLAHIWEAGPILLPIFGDPISVTWRKSLNLSQFPHLWIRGNYS